MPIRLEELIEFYEVEIWNNGKSDREIFHTFDDAKAYFEKHAKSENDCLLTHVMDEFYGPITYVIYYIN